MRQLHWQARLEPDTFLPFNVDLSQQGLHLTSNQLQQPAELNGISESDKCFSEFRVGLT